MGIIERDGNMRAAPIYSVKRDGLEPIIKAHVEPETMIYTDTWSGYKHVKELGPFKHETVNHRIKEYARGPVHVNSIEGHWSQLKRSIRGTHVHVSHKHLWKYVSEFSYRRNMRGNHKAMFSQLVFSFSLPRLIET